MRRSKAVTKQTGGGLLKHLQKCNDKLEVRANMKNVKSMTIKLTYKRSRVWGYNPHGEVLVKFEDGTCESKDGYIASGCGYDKPSTVIAQMFNDFVCGMAYRKRKTKEEVPYGLRLNGWFPSFEGSIGVNCYYSVCEFLGGRMRHVAWNDTFDQFEIEFKTKKRYEKTNN